LSLTTTPWRVRFGIGCSYLALFGAARFLPGNGLDAGDVAPRLANSRRVLELGPVGGWKRRLKRSS